MKLAYWMYAGPAHIGTLRIASSFTNVHAIMHAPLGDDYFNVMRSMLERERDFTPVTASIVDRHVLARGSQEKVVENIQRKGQDEQSDLVIVTPTCTSSILQEDLQNFVDRAALESRGDVILADVNHYRVNELQAADRTLEQVVRFYIEQAERENEIKPTKTPHPSVNILGLSTLGFHAQHDYRELKRLLHDLGIQVNLVIPDGCRVTEIKKLPKAWFNIVPYREIGLMAAKYLESKCSMPYVATTPIGMIDTGECIREIGRILQTFTNPTITSDLEARFESYIHTQTRFVTNSTWFSRSIDCQNLTGKKAVVFGDATHAASVTKILARELGIRVVCAGTYCRHDGDWFREQVQGFCDEVLITENHTHVADMIARTEPSAIFGTQMERHVGKRLDIPCGVISAPVHIQSFPLGYKPFIGYEGTNQIADLVYNSFTLGMEDHLLEFFGGHDTKETGVQQDVLVTGKADIYWAEDGIQELNQIPGFVRGKVKRNTEKFARENKLLEITKQVLYAAKEARGA